MSLLDELFGPGNLPPGRVRLGIYAPNGGRVMERDFDNRYDLYQYLHSADIFLHAHTAHDLSLQLIMDGRLSYRHYTYVVDPL